MVVLIQLRFEQVLKEVRTLRLMKQSLNLSEVMFLFCSLFSPVHIPTVFKLGSGDSGSSFGCFRACREPSVEPTAPFLVHRILGARLARTRLSAAEGVSFSGCIHKVLSL